MIGIDEVGRGCWAGPLLVVAARLTGNLPDGLKDSKVLSKKKRELYKYEIELACDIGEGWVTPAEIDHLGLTESMKLATKRALAGLEARYNETIIFDGNINFCDVRYSKASAIIDADALFPIVSAASIYAKVTRDKMMSELPDRYDVYGFASHVGYGTKVHIQALAEHGVSDIHRKSYAPIKKILDKAKHEAYHN